MSTLLNTNLFNRGNRHHMLIVPRLDPNLVIRRFTYKNWSVEKIRDILTFVSNENDL